MTRTRALAIGGGLAAFALTLALWPGEEDSPEEQVRQLVIGMARAAEGQDVGEVMEGVSERFRHAQGWSKQDLRSYLMGQVLRRTWVRVFVVDTQVSVEGNTARFTGRFILGGAETKDLKELPADTQLRSIDVEGTLEREADGRWRFVTAKHQ